ncbi:MAG: porphobilinogen synthase [Alphaproteobacteria bacterium]|nr:porphobilinogen synthase [Alphaproteobacteria bacterium]
MTHTARFPSARPRRLRAQGWIRDMAAEHRLHPSYLIWPAFVIEGTNAREPIASMPGVERLSIDLLIESAKEARDLGIPAIALFPVVDATKKTDKGEEAWNPDSLICRAVAALKKAVPDIGLITDVALDPYTSHGHDGLLKDGVILNDETVEILCKQSLTLAKAGADIIAPSDMMDGRIGAIRQALDVQGFPDKIILSYAAKYASAFYGPFRDAVNSGGFLKGDKKTYQMNPANSDEALREVALDIAEGADMVMVKPGMPYLDIVRRVKDTFRIPTLAYHVSGEYAMLRAASANGWLNYEACLMESLLSFKRAGCDAVLTYGALDAARLLKRS